MSDLTRWNRAGRSRFDYVDENAVTLLDRLRDEVVHRFGNEWDPAPPDPPDALGRYLATPHGDAGWEILRALARAIHIVTAHIDAYANEAFLATATQPEFVRRLVALLDYHVAPSSSAFTTLAFEVDGKATAPVAVSPGTAVRYQPAAGAPIVFETLFALEARLELNRLGAVGADANPHPLPNPFTLADDIPVVVGDPVVLAEGSRLATGRITSVARDELHRPVVTISPVPSGFSIGGTEVHTDPRDRLRVTSPVAATTRADDRWLRLSAAPVGLRIGDVVWLQSGSAVITHARIDGVGSYRIKVNKDPGDLAKETTVGAAFPLAVDNPAPNDVRLRGDWRWLQGKKVGVGGFDVTFRFGFVFFFPWLLDPESALRPIAVNPTLLADATVHAVTYDDATKISTLAFTQASEFAVEWVFAMPQTGAASGIRIDTPLADASASLPRVLVTSEIARTERDDFVVLADAQAAVAGRVVSVAARNETSADMSVDAWTGSPQMFPATTVAYAHFASHSRIVQWDRNDTSLDATAKVKLDDVPASLVAGRPVVLAHEPPPEDETGTPRSALASRVIAVERGGNATVPGPATVTFADPVPGDATAGSLVVYGNAVVAGHGETKPTAVIGSGAADRVRQQFVIPSTDVSTVPDPAFPAGVRLDLDVVIDGRHWQQVPTLRDAEPDDHAYVARLDDGGRALLAMGDGTHGRRLPTGRDNVVARWRVGSGLSGNLPAGSLADLVRPVNGIKAVRQPVAAAGGGSGDSVDAIRTNAPRSVLALDRAVSIGDFEALAAARGADVWQAYGHLQPGSRRATRVELVVVPAGAGPLGPALEHAVRATLEAASGPAVAISVRGHRAVPLVLDIEVAVDTSAYEVEQVRAGALASVIDRFSAAARRLGQRVTREEVVLVLEQVDGVENASCAIGEATASAASLGAVTRDGSGAVRLVHAYPDELIALDPMNPAATVLPVEYRL